jgi:hypothetical protein
VTNESAPSSIQASDYIEEWVGTDAEEVTVGLHPVVTLQYSSTTFYQVSYHIQ